jgi:DNA repair exonuclease SbcCD nuclease subunit
MNFTNDERLNLKRLVEQSECENNTDQIRRLKHSVLIGDDIAKMEAFKKREEGLKQTDPESFLEQLKQECYFLFMNYTDIFNKLLKDEIDLTIMRKLLIVLKLIEEEQVDQHEGSVMVGKILKELYVDAAIKRADALDRENKKEELVYEEEKKISWKEYKKLQL